MNIVNTRSLFSFTQQEIRLLFRGSVPIVRNSSLEIRAHSAKLPYGRLLVVLSRRVGNAVQRNKIRRRLKAIFYEEKLYERRIDLIVVGRPGAGDIPYQILKNFLRTACHAQ